ncbi:MAG: hypothetical protein SFU87_17920 [Chitinophagaceae bacterium]|nr:hypothetical protein [Chitinophagaceae bacterium]
MDWYSHFQKIFFDTWQRAGLPHHQDFIKEYIDTREHGDFKNNGFRNTPAISASVDGNQLHSVYGFGVTTGKIFAELLGLSAALTQETSDWCGRFNLGISLFDYISDEMDGTDSVTSLKAFQPFTKTASSDIHLLTPAEELLNTIAGSVLNDLRNAAANKEVHHRAGTLFKAMKQMFEAENFISKAELSAAADLRKIKKALYLKSAEPFRVMAEYTACMADANDPILKKNARTAGKALGYCYWLIDDAKDVWIDLKTGRWNLFLALAAADKPSIFEKTNQVTESELMNIWQQSGHPEKVSGRIIKRLVNAIRKPEIPEATEHYTMGLVSASLWQWYNY